VRSFSGLLNPKSIVRGSRLASNYLGIPAL